MQNKMVIEVLSEGAWLPTAQTYLRNTDIIRVFLPSGRRVITYCSDDDGEEVISSANYKTDEEFTAAVQSLLAEGAAIHIVKEWMVQSDTSQQAGQFNTQPIRATG